MIYACHARTPGLDGLAALIEGSIDPGEWVAGLRRAERARRAAA